MNSRHLSLLATATVLLTGLFLASPQSSAQTLAPLADFPKQAITIVSPFPPGGGNDKISLALSG